MIDKTKTYRTHGGLPVRIYDTEADGDYPCILITYTEGEGL